MHTVAVYYSEKDPENLRAEILRDKNCYWIAVFEKKTEIKRRKFVNKSISFLENRAEDWALGVGDL